MPNRQYSGSSGTPIKLRTNAPRQTQEQGITTNYRQPIRAEEDENPHAWTVAKPHTSAVRYTDTQGHQVIERGNKRFIFHDEPPPKRRPHWLLIFGIGMMLMLFMYVGYTAFTNWWTNHQLDTTYEYPRVFQADAVVYPGDSSQHPSHYLFLNLQGTILIVELPHGDSSKSRIYKGPTIYSDNADQFPVTGEFRVVNGKIEMLVHIQDRIILYINDGTQFIPQ